MNFKTILREAFTALNRNWVRSVLTILGIAVGVGSFICVIAIGNAGTSSIEDQLQSLGDNFVWIEAGSRARNGMRMGSAGQQDTGSERCACHYGASAADQEDVSQCGRPGDSSRLWR